MGKLSQSKNHWKKRKRSEHIYSVKVDAIINGISHMFMILARGLTRPDKAMLRKQLEKRK